MDIFFKALIAALFATIAVVGIGRAALKTNDIRNYPNLKANSSGGVQVVTVGSSGESTVTDDGAAKPDAAPGSMTQGEEAAAQSGFSTELANPNK
jgi:hypothetical protein